MLTDRDLLDLARRRLPAGPLENVLVQHGMSRAQYLQRLNRIIDTEDGLRLDPITVHNLRARREKALHRRRRTIPYP